ncbi:MAG: dTDP-4-dehydrorhamnose reductase [Desulfovibrio sp.]
MSFFQDRKAVVLGGGTGLLGQALVRALADAEAKVTATSRSELDPLDKDALTAFLQREDPAMVFNAVAHTQVDMAEEETAQAEQLNAALPEHLGRLSAELGFQLIHFSTDFVFDGRKDAAYTEEDETAPLSVYGKTKLRGEQKLLGLGLKNTLIIRSAWLFGPGRENFVSKILRLAREREILSVVHDQVGSPTYTPDLAAHTLALAEVGATGIFHVVNGGRASWCELAAEAIRIAGLNCRIEAIPSSAYPARAVRPASSQLDTSKLARTTGKTPRPWVQALRDYIYSDLAAEFAGEFGEE